MSDDTPRICPKYKAALLAVGRSFTRSEIQCDGDKCGWWTITRERVFKDTDDLEGELVQVAARCGMAFAD